MFLSLLVPVNNKNYSPDPFYKSVGQKHVLTASSDDNEGTRTLFSSIQSRHIIGINSILVRQNKKLNKSYSNNK